MRELRTPSLLISCAADFPNEAEQISTDRLAVRYALLGDERPIVAELTVEEARKREADRAYWTPLKEELEVLRRTRRKS